MLLRVNKTTLVGCMQAGSVAGDLEDNYEATRCNRQAMMGLMGDCMQDAMQQSKSLQKQSCRYKLADTVWSLYSSAHTGLRGDTPA